MLDKRSRGCYFSTLTCCVKLLSPMVKRMTALPETALPNPFKGILRYPETLRGVDVWSLCPCIENTS